MAALGGLLGIGGFVFCCGLLFVLFLVGLVLWYWRNQPDMKASQEAPQPPIQATIEHPTAAAPAPAPAPEPPAPAAPAETPAPSDTTPPSADA